jgi:hypothetical protein
MTTYLLAITTVAYGILVALAIPGRLTRGSALELIVVLHSSYCLLLPYVIAGTTNRLSARNHHYGSSGCVLKIAGMDDVDIGCRIPGSPGTGLTQAVQKKSKQIRLLTCPGGSSKHNASTTLPQLHKGPHTHELIYYPSILAFSFPHTGP